MTVFSLRRGIVAVLHRCIFPFFERSASVTPGAILLPGVAGLVEGMQDRERTHLGKPSAGLAQGALHQRKGPGGRGICLAGGRAAGLLQNPCSFCCSIGARGSRSGQIVQG